MRREEAKSDFARDIERDEWCILYPVDWIFQQHHFSPCQIYLEMDFTGRIDVIERLSNFSKYSRSNNDRIGKLWLKTAALTINTYELTECSDIDIEPIDMEKYKISFQCLYYYQFVKRNKDIRCMTFNPLELI